jgi:uncharacterized protein YjiK
LEVKFFKNLIFCLLTVSSLGACLRDDPVEGGEETEDFTNLDGLSAVCLNETSNGLLVAEDNGRVYEFDLNGTPKKVFSFPEPNNKHDWEGITKASDGTIYLCEERTREVYKLSADHKAVTLVSQGPKEGTDTNQGFEGIAAAPGVLYIANQSKPFRIYTYNLSTGVWDKAFDDITWAKSLSDIYYEESDGTLWITDAKTKKLTQIQTDGTVLKTYDITCVEKPEGYCRDAARGTYWFVCDQTSKVQKVNSLE